MVGEKQEREPSKMQETANIIINSSIIAFQFANCSIHSSRRLMEEHDDDNVGHKIAYYFHRFSMQLIDYSKTGCELC